MYKCCGGLHFKVINPQYYLATGTDLSDVSQTKALTEMKHQTNKEI